MNKQLLEDLHFILDEVEAKIGNKIEKILVEMYWQIGYCLREYPKEEITVIIKELSIHSSLQLKVSLQNVQILDLYKLMFVGLSCSKAERFCRLF